MTLQEFTQIESTFFSPFVMTFEAIKLQGFEDLLFIRTGPQWHTQKNRSDSNENGREWFLIHLLFRFLD